ncbi:MAG: xylan 1,4-beta-xylosidase [Acidimicrobiaceae bacterium]|nr:xylan 1,4-beta-xylosidase [Acidimicrobiaceae bacterium]MDQ1419126.1 xylan 1,4-beta-xylosidase [Acidimicrobiaceae bacterium]
MATVGLVLAAVVASALWWDAAGRVVSPATGAGDSSSRSSGSTRAPRGLRAQAAVGGALTGHWDAAASGTVATSYQVRVVSVADGRTVSTVETWSRSVVVDGLAVGGSYRLVVAAAGVAPPAASATATSPPVVVLADHPPDPPSQVVATALPGTNGLEVHWAPAATGVTATGAMAQLYDGPTSKGYVRCQASCTTATFRGLEYARSYSVRVVPINPAGEGPATASNAVDLHSFCLAVPSCSTVDATVVMGPARQRAQGFLDSIYPVGDMVARVRQLKPQSWRGAPTYLPATGALDWSSWDAAVATGAETTLLLSSLWHSETTTGAGARPPWADWGAYATWVTATVRAIRATGRRVSYWEIQNEPGAPTYFSPADSAAATVADYLEQFRVAYGAIKEADPAAKIIGPSLSHFADYPGEYLPNEPDLVTFLDFAARNGLRLAAVSWHEIDDDLGPNPRDYSSQPQRIEDHVAEARRLIAERVALGGPAVWVNEYGRHVNYAIPGWTLGDIAAIEAASVDRAGRSCWPEQGPGGALYDDCPAPTLDGLLAADGSTPRANYWVYATYARMTGRLVATASSDATISVLATRDDGSERVQAMVGRHVGCLPGVNLSCTRADAGTVAATPVPNPVPIPVSLEVRVPWATATAKVTIAQVSPTWGPLPNPPTVFQGPVTVNAGRLTLVLPAVADGEVYLVTIGR